jgi:hypothetical protein
MSEIRFVNLLGDAIEEAIGQPATAPERRRRGLRIPRRRGRLVMVIAALALGGVAYAATQQNSTTLVAGGIACYQGTSFNASAYFNVQANGRSPQAACAQVFRTGGQPRLASAQRLVACADPHGYVAVFRQSGTADQCRSLGLSALQAAPYVAAAHRESTLIKQLTIAGDHGRCVAPHTLLRRVQAVLDRLGWTGWHAEIFSQLSQRGSCGLFMASGAMNSDPSQSLNGQRRIVWIVTEPAGGGRPLGAPRPVRRGPAKGG